MKKWRKKRDYSGALMLIAFSLVVMISSIALASSKLLVFNYGAVGFLVGFVLFLVSAISMA